jgi:hypothetical protein
MFEVGGVLDSPKVTMGEGAAPAVPRPFLLKSTGAYKLPGLRLRHYLQLVDRRALAPATKQAGDVLLTRVGS